MLDFAILFFKKSVLVIWSLAAGFPSSRIFTFCEIDYFWLQFFSELQKSLQYLVTDYKVFSISLGPVTLKVLGNVPQFTNSEMPPCDDLAFTSAFA